MTEHDHNYLSTKGPGDPARGPLTPLQRLFAKTDDDAATSRREAHLRFGRAQLDADALPEPGLWPCQSDRMPSPPPRLVSALYVLLRDHVKSGDMEQVMLNLRGVDRPQDFTNGHLEGYAQSLTAFLLAEWRPGVHHTGQPATDAEGEDGCDDPNCPVCGVP